MKDIALDFANKKMLNETIDNKERVIQQIKVSVRSWLGDFFLNDNFGIDYDNCWGNATLLQSYIKEQVEAIDGVFVVNNISIEKAKDDNIHYFKVSIQLTYDNDVIVVKEEITGR